MQLDDSASILAKADFFDICDAEQRRLLAFASERMQFSSGDVIYQSGSIAEGAHVLVSGSVSTSTDDREVHPYRTSQPGSLLGMTSLVLQKPRPLTITALTSVETLMIPRSAFMKLARQSPDLAQRAAQRIQQELSSYLGAIERIRPRFGSE